MKKAAREDPMEKIVRDALTLAAVDFVEEEDARSQGLDFYLPGSAVHIEVKQFHSPRVAEQMSRADNVIAIQGLEAARFFAGLIAATPEKETAE
jgi:hypothetical protein